MTKKNKHTAVRKPQAPTKREATENSPLLEDRESNKHLPSLEDQVDFEPPASDEKGELTENGAVADPAIMEISSPRTEKEPSPSQSPSSD